MVSGQQEKGAKVLLESFGKEGSKIPTVTVLNFRLGQIMPEEFLYILDRYLEKEEEQVDTILFSDTAQLRTRFPLLQKEGLFLPALVDITKSWGLTSIFKEKVAEALGYSAQATTQAGSIPPLTNSNK